MGALHEGHVSLIREAQRHCEVVICSIFVNPTQFNDVKDLDKYPRTLDHDLVKLEQCGCNIAFTPTVTSVYKDEQAFEFDFNGLDETMEGANRPGHFMGVVRVVKRLFEIVTPDLACFGLKDFQQFAIIKELVRQFKFPIEIIGCPIIREESGLAMSSRNVRLSDEEKERALVLYRVLNHVRSHWNTMTVDEAKQYAMDELSKFSRPEYFEIAESTFLKPVKNWDAATNLRAFVAAHVGDVRLIDNMALQ